MILTKDSKHLSVKVKEIALSVMDYQSMQIYLKKSCHKPFAHEENAYFDQNFTVTSVRCATGKSK